MEIVNPVREKEVEDYDFAFANGARTCQVLDHEAGDFAQELDDRYILVLTAKPRPTNPEELMPQEIVTIFKNQVVALVTRKHKVRLPTQEEAFEMKETLYKLSKQVH